MKFDKMITIFNNLIYILTFNFIDFNLYHVPTYHITRTLNYINTYILV